LPPSGWIGERSSSATSTLDDDGTLSY
jgi:hypothetical protein